MFKNIIRFLGGDPHKRQIQQYVEIVAQVNSLEKAYEQLSDDALRAKTLEFKQRLANEETLDDLLPEAFAAVREASKRTIGLRHYDVQLIGGMVLHRGMIAEMRTGEGKTLVATLPVYLNALTGRGVHLVTVNDYLARRDARWMAPIYSLLGLQVGVLQMAPRTENGKNAFIVDLEKRAPHEDQDQLRTVLRGEAYVADVTYGTNSEFGFDYLRDNLTLTLEERSQRGHYFAIVDEVDNILIDEARTPLIISGPAQDEAEWYVRMAQVVRQLTPDDYEINEKDKAISLTEAGEAHVEQIMDMPLRDPERPEDIQPEQARILGHLEQGLRAHFLFRKNKDYLVQAGKVVIVDEFTGRLMPGRRWSEGLHQAIEAKEGVKVEPENVTYATITLQNYFRMYEKLAGMTGTALTEAEEFAKIYKLEVLPIPTNLEYVAMQEGAPLMEVEAKDEQGYKYTYYSHRGDAAKKPAFWRRKDFPDVVYRTEEGKVRAITQEILNYYVQGRPQLVGTTSVEHSERLSDRLKAEPVRRLAQILLVRQAWMEKNDTDMITKPVPELLPLNPPIESLNVGEIRQVGRTLGVSMNVEDPENVTKLLKIMGLKTEHGPRLVKALQAGVPHEVLNARKHDEESMIIAHAGAFGAVTIATNMAGRGVDIKLGGDLSEEILRDVNRVLDKVADDPYDLTNQERHKLLLEMPVEQYGIYEEPVKAFLQHMQDMDRVHELGGLHVIGSERHEARRIDNQLRGRAARQGDPGSSRFYLSLEDELMRLFGGQQVESLWKRILADENQPIEVGMLGRLVEQSQERVEGSNFDVRKHLLEYDDVLNSQRKRIYGQRDRVFEKEDLSEDIHEMLQVELAQRIPTALKDEEGPWKLLAYLDEIQPPINFETVSCPSFTFRLLIDEARRPLPENGATAEQVRKSLMDVAARALATEKEHQLKSTQKLLDSTLEALEHNRDERFEALDTFFDGFKDRLEEEVQPRPQDLFQELSELVRVQQMRLNPEQMRQLAEGDRELVPVIRKQIEDALLGFGVTRLVASLERRLEESLNFRTNQFQGLDWGATSALVIEAVEKLFAQRAERLLGEDGQIVHDLDGALSKTVLDTNNERQWVELLIYMTQGTRLAFDRRTHRKGQQRYNRLNYVFLTAQLMQDAGAKEVTERVLEHLEDALERLQTARGLSEWNRLVHNEATLSQMDERRRAHLAEALGVERFEELANQPVSAFGTEERDLVSHVLGKFWQNEVYRELLLQIISEQWVDYLTSVEALRVSIGLEAYAQRDPLVSYKGRATEMFTQLLADIRIGVISRLFTYQSSRAAIAAFERERPEEVVEEEQASLPDNGDGGSSVNTSARASSDVSHANDEANRAHKKKRHRH